MKRMIACLAAALTSTLLAPASARANNIGISVFGEINFGALTTNFFDPANGTVPAAFLNATQGTTVTVADPAVEFGLEDLSGSASFTANFTPTQLIVTTGGNGSIHFANWTMRFTSSGFANQSINEVSDNFGFGGVSAALNGDVVTLTWPGSGPFGPSDPAYTAVYDISAQQSGAVPEPASMLLLGSGLVAAVRMRQRSRT